jgi:hypothetical protein
VDTQLEVEFWMHYYSTSDKGYIQRFGKNIQLHDFVAVECSNQPKKFWLAIITNIHSNDYSVTVNWLQKCSSPQDYKLHGTSDTIPISSIFAAGFQMVPHYNKLNEVVWRLMIDQKYLYTLGDDNTSLATVPAFAITTDFQPTYHPKNLGTLLHL